MKKLIALAIALLFIIPAFAMADDKVSVAGSYDLFMYDMDNYNDLNDNVDDEQSYLYSRFRMATTIKPADDITAYFRFDLQEGTWGVNYNGGSWRRGLTGPAGSTSGDNQIHIDYAWVKVDKEMYAVQVGWQYIGFGLGLTEFGTQAIHFTFKTPVTIDLWYAKFDENGSTSDDAKANDDEDLYAAKLGYKSDAFNADLFYAIADDSSTDSEQWVFGLFGTATLGAVDLTAEINKFGGDNGGAIDYDGTQFVLQGKMNMNEQLMLGLQLIYAQGSDDPNEIIINGLGDVWSFRPLSYGLMETWDCEPVDPFAIDTNAGMQALQLICDYKATDALLIQGALAYAQPEEDDVTVIDSGIIFNLSFKYTFATNAFFGLHYNYMAADGDTGVDLDDASAIMGRFGLSF